MKKEKTKERARKVPFKVYIRNTWQLYLMLLIPVIYMLMFRYRPMIGGVIAFKKFNVFAGMWNSPWVGFANFREAFGSSDFWNALKNTLILNLGDLILGFPIPVLLAVFLFEIRNVRIRKATQTILYLPHFLSWVIIAGIITQLFSTSGLVNDLIRKAGFGEVNFLSSPFIWRFVYWFSGIWQAAGYSLIIYLASLAATDPSLGEAAYIDGATRLQRIVYVTIPQIRPTISIMLIMQLGKIVSIDFDRPYMMGNTLVKSASDVISTYVYSVGLQSGRFDFATAVGLFQSLVGIVLILSVNKISKKMGEEGIM